MPPPGRTRSRGRTRICAHRPGLRTARAAPPASGLLRVARVSGPLSAAVGHAARLSRPLLTSAEQGRCGEGLNRESRIHTKRSLATKLWGGSGSLQHVVTTLSLGFQKTVLEVVGGV